MDGHEFHFFDITQTDGTKKPVSIPSGIALFTLAWRFILHVVEFSSRSRAVQQRLHAAERTQYPRTRAGPKKFTAGTIIPSGWPNWTAVFRCSTFLTRQRGTDAHRPGPAGMDHDEHRQTLQGRTGCYHRPQRHAKFTGARYHLRTRRNQP